MPSDFALFGLSHNTIETNLCVYSQIKPFQDLLWAVQMFPFPSLFP